MFRYKITSITDRQGIPKEEFLAELKKVHPNLTGRIEWPDKFMLSKSLMFVWDDESNKMLRTSRIEKIVCRTFGFEIVTKNSIYTLEKLKN